MPSHKLAKKFYRKSGDFAEILMKSSLFLAPLKSNHDPRFLNTKTSNQFLLPLG